MARKKREQRKNRPAPRNSSQPTVLDRARDELFSAIRQCGVIAAEREDQVEWMEDTLGFMKERTGTAPAVLRLETLNAGAVLAFLDHLESQRGCSVRSPSCRCICRSSGATARRHLAC